MEYGKRTLDLSSKVKKHVSADFENFGINKKREISRLVFEICKRDDIKPHSVLKGLKGLSFAKTKARLLKIRYPHVSRSVPAASYYIPGLDISEENESTWVKNPYAPKKIVYEKKTSSKPLVKKLKKTFSESDFQEIPSLKEYLADNRPFSITEYNRRRDLLIVSDEKFDFIKRCPCTKNAVCCGYNVMNLGFGCIYECTYCFLQEYINSPGIILSSNINDFFERFSKKSNTPMRLGTGEFGDSLMLDNITEYSKEIVDFFSKYTSSTFEFKTKSDNVDNLLVSKHSGNIVVSWSLTTEKISEKNEFFSASVSERLISARKCARAGYKIGIHFDPIILYDEWKKDYALLIDRVFSYLKPVEIAWISLGTLRFNPGTKKIIENRFPNNTILDQELVPGFDAKLRYSYDTRLKIYKFIINKIKEHAWNLTPYLCMESRQMWRSTGLKMVF